MSTLRDLNLEFNPFRDITPNIDDSNMVWAGMEEVKAKLERSYNDCLRNNSKQIILNWGPYGGGKTFSAFYFANKKKDVDNLTHIYIRCPKEGAKATDEFFKSIIDAFSFELLNNHIHELIERNGLDSLIHYLTPRATREFAKAICLIGSKDAEISEMMNRFLYSGLTKTELRKLELAKDIQTDNDSVKFLSGLLACFTGNANLFNGRIVFWLDEMEDLIYFAPKNYKIFSQILRDLFDNIPDRFLFFMNFTLSENEDTTIELILGGALWSRVTKKIRYKEFSGEDALKYIHDLLLSCKINKREAKPFNNDLLKIIINNIPPSNLTPREINKHINSLVSYALDQNLTAIDKEVFGNWLKEFAEES